MTLRQRQWQRREKTRNAVRATCEFLERFWHFKFIFFPSNSKIWQWSVPNIFPVRKEIFFETWLARLCAIKRITPAYCWAYKIETGFIKKQKSPGPSAGRIHRRWRWIKKVEINGFGLINSGGIVLPPTDLAAHCQHFFSTSISTNAQLCHINHMPDSLFYNFIYFQRFFSHDNQVLLQDWIAQFSGCAIH